MQLRSQSKFIKKFWGSNLDNFTEEASSNNIALIESYLRGTHKLNQPRKSKKLNFKFLCANKNYYNKVDVLNDITKDIVETRKPASKELILRRFTKTKTPGAVISKKDAITLLNKKKIQLHYKKFKEYKIIDLKEQKKTKPKKSLQLNLLSRTYLKKRLPISQGFKKLLCEMKLKRNLKTNSLNKTRFKKKFLTTREIKELLHKSPSSVSNNKKSSMKAGAGFLVHSRSKSFKKPLKPLEIVQNLRSGLSIEDKKKRENHLEFHRKLINEDLKKRSAQMLQYKAEFEKEVRRKSLMIRFKKFLGKEPMKNIEAIKKKISEGAAIRKFNDKFNNRNNNSLKCLQIKAPKALINKILAKNEIIKNQIRAIEIRFGKRKLARMAEKQAQSENLMKKLMAHNNKRFKKKVRMELIIKILKERLDVNHLKNKGLKFKITKKRKLLIFSKGGHLNTIKKKNEIMSAIESLEEFRKGEQEQNRKLLKKQAQTQAKIKRLNKISAHLLLLKKKKKEIKSLCLINEVVMSTWTSPKSHTYASCPDETFKKKVSFLKSGLGLAYFQVFDKKLPYSISSCMSREDSFKDVKNQMGKKNPIHLVKNQINNDVIKAYKDNYMLRFKFHDKNALLEDKTTTKPMYFCFKQKRYKVRNQVTEIYSDYNYKNHKKKPLSFTGNHVLKNNYNVESKTNISNKAKGSSKKTDLKMIQDLRKKYQLINNTEGSNRLQRLIKKSKARSENFNVTLSKRLLRVKKTLVIPTHVNITAITNSYDVVHSWFIPGLGLKMDCVPGRSTHHTFYVDNAGFYYGQCAEICGRYHHHMPIRVCALPFEHFLLWWNNFGLPHLMRTGKKDFIKEYSFRKYSW